jgi:osmoprotectant transport system ATP-binding protein
LIQLENVSKVYPDGTEAVKDLSLEISEGEFCVFLGPSGCGKTTSLKMINRLIPITRGRITINGVDTQQRNVNDLRRDIGYAIQNIGLFPHLTVAQNIATVPTLKHWPRERRRQRARELLNLVGMPPDTFMDRYPSELSGGQQQRVGVARCLGADPPILLMDEPFGAIDPITRHKLQGEFLKIQERLRKTIAFVTHDIDEAIKLGDTIALMKDGELVQYAEPATLLAEPKTRFVRDFVGADRVLKGLRLLRARDVMKMPKTTIRIDESVSHAVAVLDERRRHWMAALDDDGRFQGWIEREDLETASSLEEAVTPAVTTASPRTPLNEALSMMLASATGSVAVLDDDLHLVGLLSFSAIREVLSADSEEDDE